MSRERGDPSSTHFFHASIIQVSIVVSKVPVSQVVNTARKVLYTGVIGDGKIFIYNVEKTVLGDVQAFQLLLRGDPQADGVLDD